MAPGAAAPERPRRRRTTPASLRLLLIGLLAAAVAYGAAGTWTVIQHASAAQDVVSTSEPLSLAAQRMYQALSDADVTATTAFLAGPNVPLAARERYAADISSAAADLTSLEGAATTSANAPLTRSLAAVAAGLPVYTGYVSQALPVPQVDSADPAAGFLATLSTLDAEQRTAVLSAAAAGDQGTPQAVAQSAETRLALARSRIVTGDLAGAGTVLADLAAEEPGDWRIPWYHGLRELSGGNPAGARAAFDAVVGALPGELAPKLALALAAEAAGDQAAADRYFRLVWTVDHAYISAVFGLARARLAAGDPASAIAALATVPDTSSHHLAAQVAAVRIQVSPRPGQAQVPPGDLGEAGARVDRLKLDAVQLEHLTAEVLRAALASALAGGTLPAGSLPGGRLLGCEFTERSLRFGLERSYRAQARLAPDRRRRIELADAANGVRPRTWV